LTKNAADENYNATDRLPGMKDIGVISTGKLSGREMVDCRSREVLKLCDKRGGEHLVGDVPRGISRGESLVITGIVRAVFCVAGVVLSRGVTSKLDDVDEFSLSELLLESYHRYE